MIHTLNFAQYFYGVLKTCSTLKHQSSKRWQDEWARSAECVGGNVLQLKTGLMLHTSAKSFSSTCPSVR